MICLAAASTSGAYPKKRRRGMTILLPSFISAINFQNSASVLSRFVRLSCRFSPLFFRPNEFVAVRYFHQKKRFILAVTTISPPSLCIPATDRSQP